MSSEKTSNTLWLVSDECLREHRSTRCVGGFSSREKIKFRGNAYSYPPKKNKKKIDNDLRLTAIVVGRVSNVTSRRGRLKCKFDRCGADLDLGREYCIVPIWFRTERGKKKKKPTETSTVALASTLRIFIFTHTSH